MKFPKIRLGNKLAKVILSATFALICNGIRAGVPLVHSLSLTTGADYVASSVEDDIRPKIPADDKIYVRSAVPFSLRYSFSFTDPDIRNYYPGGYQGISVGTLNLGSLEPRGWSKATRNIGYPVLVYLFQGAPFWNNSRGFSLAYEWNFGAAIGWKPYSEANERFNLTVGSQVNAYLNLNLFACYEVSTNLKLFGGVAVSHFSNGNTSFPNPGINSLGLRIGVEYTLNPPEKGFPPVKEADTEKDSGKDGDKDCEAVKRRKLEYDLSLWGASRKRVYRGGEEPVLLPGHFACAGISFAPMVRLNTWWRVGGSFDLQWDRSSGLKRYYISGTTTEDIKFSTPNFFRQVTVGLSAHGELQMPVFAVNVGIGVNLIAPWENRGTYQNITLKTYVCRKIFINVGYQLRNFYQQSSLMLGMGASF